MVQHAFCQKEKASLSIHVKLVEKGNFIHKIDTSSRGTAWAHIIGGPTPIFCSLDGELTARRLIKFLISRINEIV